METKHLYRSSTNQVFGGVLGGIGEYFTIDPVLVRLIFIVFLIVTGFLPGIIIYILALFVVPFPTEEFTEVKNDTQQ